MQAKACHDANRENCHIMRVFVHVAVLNPVRKLFKHNLKQEADQYEYANVVIITVVSIGNQVQNGNTKQVSPAERQHQFQRFVVIAFK